MILNSKVTDFIKSANSQLIAFCETNNCFFNHPSDSEIIERMMRIGIEARCLGATEEDEFRAISVATLKQDFIKHWQSQEQKQQRKKYLVGLANEH